MPRYQLRERAGHPADWFALRSMRRVCIVVTHTKRNRGRDFILISAVHITGLNVLFDSYVGNVGDMVVFMLLLCVHRSEYGVPFVLSFRILLLQYYH